MVHNIWKKRLIDIGLQHTFIPPEFGGMRGGTVVEFCALVSEVSRGDFGIACSGFISPWSIASISMPKPNEVLLKKLDEDGNGGF